MRNKIIIIGLSFILVFMNFAVCVEAMDEGNMYNLTGQLISQDSSSLMDNQEEKKVKTIQELAELSRSVVLIKVYNDKGEVAASGSGVVISDDGLIVTNLHVLYGGAYYGILFEGMEEDFEYQTFNIVGVDPEKDLALIQLHKNTTPISLGDSDSLVKGEKVVAIGSPLGLENTISDGIISGVREFEDIEIIQTTTPISPGSSGGALLNMEGKLVGITSMVHTNGQNINFAIPSKYIVELLNKEETKLNMEIADNASLFLYNKSLMTFDNFHYFDQKGKYIINFFENTAMRLDFDIFMTNEDFKKRIEETYIQNIEEIIREYGVKKYSLHLFAGSYRFSYEYNQGKITKKIWKKEKEASTSKWKKEKILKIDLGDIFYTLDPQLNSSVSGYHIINNLFEGLMKEENGQLKYGMARKYTISEDGKTYTFYLRNAKWSDGEPVKASDFEYAWKRALNPENAAEYAFQLFCIEGAQDYYMRRGRIEDVAVKAVDDKTLKVTLNRPTPYFPKMTTLPIYMPVRKDAVEKNPQGWAEDPATFVSNGPFQLENYVINFKAVLTKNKHYYNRDDVKLDGIEFFTLENAAIALSGYKAGIFDMINDIPQEEMKTLMAKDHTFRKIPQLGTYYYILNVKKAPLDNIKVRKALSMVLDGNAVNNSVLEGRQTVAMGFVPPGISTSDGRDFREAAQDDGSSVDKTKIKEAKKLLAEAGYPNGENFPELVITFSTNATHKAIAESIQAMWEKNLGIKVKLEEVTWAEGMEKMNQGDFMIARMGWIGDYADPMAFLELWTSNAYTNHSGWSNEQYDKLIEESYGVSGTKRDQILLEAERILMEERVVLPIYYYTDAVMIKENVHNWQRTGLGYWYFGNVDIK